MNDILLVIGAYLFGSLPVLFWIGRARGFDIRQEYDAHLSLWRKVGFREGLAGILWDIFKGPVPPIAAWAFDASPLTVGLCGIAVVAGQMYPVFLGFRHGEKGNTTGIGASFGVSPVAMGLAAIPIATGAFMRLLPKLRRGSRTEADRFKFTGISNSMPLGMLSGFAVLPLAAWLIGENTDKVWTLVALTGLIIFRRITADLMTEMKTGLKSSLASVLWNRFLYDRSYYNEPPPGI